MKSFAERVKPFLEYLELCGGCLNKRTPDKCKFALECAVTEVLSKRGLVTNAEDLITYCDGNRGSGYFPRGCYGARDVKSEGVNHG